MQELYEILGVSQDSTMEEIEEAYKNLRAKYARERFLDGEKGNNAAKMLTKIDNAYLEIKAERIKMSSTDYAEIERDIKNGNVSSAQEKLDQVSERDANWHYLQSVVFYKKNWINESKKQLELAMSLEPNNTKFSDAYTKLNEKISRNNAQFRSGDSSRYAEQQAPQMGGSSLDGCCSWCTTMCCMNMMLDICCQC